MKKITVAHSPDTDDHFLFWAIKYGSIETSPYSFAFHSLDTEDLNHAAKEEAFDVVAISLASYPGVSSKYLLLPHGASVGRNYGPVVISKNVMSLSDLNNARVAVPGETTTARLLLNRYAANAKTITVPLTPYGAVYSKLSQAEVDAAVLIHEGQISFLQSDFHLVADLGKLWREETSLPIPVGVNVIHKRLEESIEEVSAILRRSIRYALDHKKEILPLLFEQAKLQGGQLADVAQLERYLSMYANEDSYDLDTDCRRAVVELVGEVSWSP